MPDLGFDPSEHPERLAVAASGGLPPPLPPDTPERRLITERRTTRTKIDTLPRYATWRDVLECFGGSWDKVIDAYCFGHLPPHAEDALEIGMDTGKFQCLLLRRQIRLLLGLEQIARAWESDRQRAGTASGASGASGGPPDQLTTYPTEPPA